jgi:AsnC-like helix-turn-helix protein
MHILADLNTTSGVVYRKISRSIVENRGSNYEQFFNNFPLFFNTMSEAYVLINCNLGTEDLVINELRSVSGVSEVKGVFGVYDVIARINADSEVNIKKVIAKIRSMSNIKSSLTMMVIEGQGS